MVSFLFIHKFDIEAGSGDRCNSFRSPEYLLKNEKKEAKKLEIEYVALRDCCVDLLRLSGWS